MSAFLMPLLAALLCGPVAAAQQPQAGEEEILVTGERDRGEALRAYVEEVTVETGGQIPRFAEPICPASFGLPSGHNEVVVERLRLIAEHLGIGAARRDCRPNVVVVVTDSGGDFVRSLRRERPELFAALELRDLRTVMRQPGPVRTWQAIEPRGADGRPMATVAFLEVNGGLQYIGRARHLTGVMPSLTQRPTRQDLSLSFIVFDLDAIEGLTLLQIADHAAMRALARTEPARLPPRWSILTMFSDRDAAAAPAEELTSWDAAYLHALYRTANVVGAHQQRASIANTMRRALEERP